MSDWFSLCLPHTNPFQSPPELLLRRSSWLTWLTFGSAFENPSSKAYSWSCYHFPGHLSSGYGHDAPTNRAGHCFCCWSSKRMISSWTLLTTCCWRVGSWVNDYLRDGSRVFFFRFQLYAIPLAGCCWLMNFRKPGLNVVFQSCVSGLSTYQGVESILAKLKSAMKWLRMFVRMIVMSWNFESWIASGIWLIYLMMYLISLQRFCF